MKLAFKVLSALSLLLIAAEVSAEQTEAKTAAEQTYAEKNSATAAEQITAEDITTDTTSDHITDFMLAFLATTALPALNIGFHRK